MSAMSSPRNKSTRLHRLPSRPGEILNDGQSCPSSPAVKKVYRLVVVGSAKTGKTSIVDRFLDREFEERYIPTIENFHRKLYKIRGEVYQLDVVDCSGNDPFPAARKLCYLSGDMFIIVGSIDEAHSVEAMADLAQQITECKTNHNNQAAVPIVFACNKSDLPEYRWQLEKEDFQHRLTDLAVDSESIIFCSASSGDNIDRIFGKLFSLGKCPKHMNPELHKMLRNELSADGDGKDTKSRRHLLQRMKSRFSKDGDDDLTVYTDVNARRPSLRTDLLLNRAKTSVQLQHNTNNNAMQTRQKCTIS